MIVREPVVLISRYPPSTVLVLSSVTTSVLPMYTSASYEIVLMSLTKTNSVVLLGSSLLPERVCETSGIVLRVNQSSSCVVTSIVIAEAAVVGDSTGDVVSCVGWVCVVFVGFGDIVDSPVTLYSGVIFVGVVVVVVSVVVVVVSVVAVVVGGVVFVVFFVGVFWVVLLIIVVSQSIRNS